MTKHLTRLILVLATLALAACAGAPATVPATSQKGNGGDEEYVYQSSLGSRIPRKVKKSQVATSEEHTEKTQDALREAQMHGSSTPGGN